MAEAQAAARRVKGEDLLTAILEVPLRDASAGERRVVMLKADDRDLEDVTSGFDELDALIDDLYSRLDELLVIESAPPMPVDLEPEQEIAASAVIEVEEDVGATAGTVQDIGQTVPELRPPSLPTQERPKRQQLDAEALQARQSSLLYEDVIWLLAINDGVGALISLERLIVTARASDEVNTFLEVNEKKLLSLYEGFIGPFTKIPRLRSVPDGTDMPQWYRQNDKIAVVMGLVDGQRSIAELIKSCAYTGLQTCCILNQLRRSALIEIVGAPES